MNEEKKYTNEEKSYEETMIEQEEKVATNPFVMVGNIIFSPSKALKAIKVNSSLIVPIIIATAIPLLYYLLFWSDIQLKMAQLLEAQMESYNMDLTQEMMDMQMGIAKISTFVGVIFGPAVIGLISGLYMFICSKIAKTNMTYKQSVSIAYHIAVITALSSILYMVFSLVGFDYNLAKPMTSVASILPSSLDGSVVQGFLLPFEVFGIWGSIVTYMAFRIVGKMSNKAALISTLLAFSFKVFLSVGSVLMTSLMSNFY